MEQVNLECGCVLMFYLPIFVLIFENGIKIYSHFVNGEEVVIFFSV